MIIERSPTGTGCSLDHLVHHTKLEVLLIMVIGGVAVLVLVAVVQHGLAGDALLPPGDGGHFADSPGGAVTDVSPLDRLAVPLATSGALHLRGPVGVHSSNVTVFTILTLLNTTECVCHIVIVIFIPPALHKEPGPLHKLVHRHVGGDGAGDHITLHQTVVANPNRAWSAVHET